MFEKFMSLSWRWFVLTGVIFFLCIGSVYSQTSQIIHYDSGYTWRGYTGTIAPTCQSKLCHYNPINAWDSVYKEFTAWKSANGNPNSANVFINFRVIFPPGYNIKDTVKKYPLIVLMHGAGESGRVWSTRYNYVPTDSMYDNNSHTLRVGGNEHRQAVGKPTFNPGSFPGIVVFPQASYNGVWGDTTSTVLSENEKLLVGFIEDQLIARYHADVNRIVMHGLSNGAKSLWAVAQKRPDLFAAILPMSGVPYNPPDKAAAILLTTPIRLYQGGLDLNPSPNAAQKVINAFVAKGGNPQLISYPDLGHRTWLRAYREHDFFTWIRAQDKRNIYVFGGTTELCNNSIKLGFSANMVSYQWTKDGSDIPGAHGRYLENIIMPGIYTVKFKRPNGKWDTSFSVNIVLNPGCVIIERPVLSTTLNATVCSDVASGITLDDNGIGVNAATFNITAINFNGLVASAGSPVLGTGFLDKEIFNDVYTNTGAQPVNVVYTIVPVSSAGNAGDAVNVTLTVNPKTLPGGALAVTRCSDVASGIILDTNNTNKATFSITAINSNGLVASAGSPAIGTDFGGMVISDDAYTNTGTKPVEVVYTVVPINATGCLVDGMNVTLTVNPEPVLLTTIDTTICSDAANGIILNDIGGSVNTSTFNITDINFNGLVASAGSPSAGTSFSAAFMSDDAYTNVGDAPKNVVYTIMPVSSAGCFGNPTNVTLTVSPEPALSTGLDTIANSDVASGIILDVGSSANSSTFTISAINFNGLVPSGGSPETGRGFSATAISDDAYTNSGSLPVNVVYTIVPVSDAGCSGNAATVTLKVHSKTEHVPPGTVVTGIRNFQFSGTNAVAYPNPTKGTVVITFEEAIKLHSIQVLSAIGQLIQVPAKQINDRTMEVDLTELSTGLYLFRVKDNGRLIRVLKE